MRPRGERASRQKAHARGVSGREPHELLVQIHPGHGRHHEVAQDQIELLTEPKQAQRRCGVGDGDDGVLPRQ